MPRDSRAAHADPALPVTPPSIELLIGELTAAAACLLAQAADEMESGRMAGDTKRQGGERIVALVELRQAAGKLDFERVAQAHGSRVLRERCGSDISAATIDALVAAGIDILGKVVRSQAN